VSWFYVVATLVAAMLIGFGFVLQQHAAMQVRTAEFLRPGLIAKLIRNRRWLGGIAALAAGDLLGAWTLGHLRLSITEPLLTTNLIFALLLAVPLSGQALRRTEIIGALLLTAGVGTLSATRTVKSPGESFGSVSHWPVAGLIALIAAILLYAGRRRSGTVRATLTGAASGLVFGIADALTRSSVQTLDGHSPAHLLTTWPGYATVATSVVGLWLMQNAFNAAPLHASLPAVTATEPVAGIVLGVVVFGDVVHVSPWLLAAQAAGLAAVVGGAVLVARAPVFSDLNLRQLPQAALERLPHPGLPVAGRGSGRDSGRLGPAERSDHPLLADGVPLLADASRADPAPSANGSAPTDSPTDSSSSPGSPPLVPGGHQSEGNS
jgi:drug/metabolite transporter (DMT)-like permease